MILLNEEQSRAVNAPNRPVLVLAGAGTGKTRVLIERIIKHINGDLLDHRRILAITFTNKAKDEIRARIAGRIGDSRIPPNIFTFHAFFHKLLRTDIWRLDRSLDRFKLLDDNDQRAIIRRLLKELRITRSDTLKPLEPREAEMALGWLKISTRDLADGDPVAGIARAARVTVDEIMKLYGLYQRELRTNNLLDYNDLEIFAHRLLDLPDMRSRWRGMFDAILIDEFQDTSGLQMEIVKKLADSGSNIFCVGDPDQSIYGFRGAKPRVCAEFLEHFGAECVKLECNYRSTQTILDISNRLIAKNHTDSRILKSLRSAKPDRGGRVVCARFDDEWEEVRFVADEIERIIRSDPEASLRDFAILYRNNIFSRLFEIVFRERRMECEVANTVDFFARTEIKFMVAFLRLLFFCDDRGVGMYIMPVAETLKMGVGEGTCQALCRFMSDRGLNLEECMGRLAEVAEVKSRARSGLERLWGWIVELRPLRGEGMVRIMEEVMRISGYAEMLRERKEEGRAENIRMFAESLAENPEGKTNREMVEEISLRARGVRRSRSSDHLFLSTVHQAKGLEYKYVFVVKMLQGVFPSSRSRGPEEQEEERRLAYVAFTRAKKLLYVTCSPTGGRGSGSTINAPSVFLNELQKMVGDVDYRDRRRIRGLGPNSRRMGFF